MAVADIHPSIADLEAFTLGTLDDASLAGVEAHVADCPICQQRAAGASGDTLVALLRRVHAQAARRIDTVAEAEAQTPAPVPAHPEPITLARAAAAHTVVPATVDFVPGELAQIPPTRFPGAGPAATVDYVPGELARHERYRVVRLLGEGGMGCVYEAEHRVMQRPVALKVINRAYTAKPAAVERFRREVRAAARLSHPNIVTTYDAEDAGNTLFLVMEYVEGVSLARLVKERGPLPVAEACDYVRQAALGLQHAHECGMVHRDIKPDNLMLVASPVASAPGVVKVLDFGLAVLTAERGGGLTDTNAIMGTPDYMAPEQAEDPRSADIRADVYSLGCTLYYLLTGNVPYPAATPLLKILAHRDQPLPAVCEVRPEVPPELAGIMVRLLAKKPEDRYQTPGDVAAALKALASDEQPNRQGDREPRRKRGWLVAAAVLFIGLVVAGAIYRIQTDTGELIITTESDDVKVVIKQGGKLVEIIDTKTDKQIKISLRSGAYELELKGAPEGLKLNIDKATLTRGETQLAKIERVPEPGVAPKPSVSEPQPTVAEKVGQVRQFVSHSNEIRSVAFSPDGRIILTGAMVDTGLKPGDCDVQLWDAATGKELHRLKGLRSSIGGAAFSRDGKFVVAGGAWNDPSIIVWEVESGRVRHQFINKPIPGVAVTNVVFSKDGRFVFSSSNGLRRGFALRMWNLETDKEDNKHFDEGATSVGGLAVSHHGRWLAACPDNTPSVIQLWEIETGKLVKLFARNKKEDGERIQSIVFTPDDSQLISGDYKLGLRLWDVRTGMEIPRFDVISEKVSGVDVSPDSRRVVCAHGRTVGIWDLETGKEIHRFEGHSLNTQKVAFSPDGRFVLSSSTDNTARLWRLPAPAKPAQP